MSNKPITEDDLQAFVDNALDTRRRDEVAEFLLTNEAAAKRVATYKRQASILRSALDPVAREPVPSRLNLASIAQARQPRPPFRIARMAVAAALLLTIGASGGWLMKGLSLPASEGVAALALEASATYGVFAPNTTRPVEVRVDDTDTLRQLASTTLGTSAVIPELKAAGYRLMGGRIIPTAHGAALMLMYDNDTGRRLMILTRHMFVDQDKPMTASQQGEISGWSWAKNGMGYSLVGSLPSEELHPIANAMRAQI